MKKLVVLAMNGALVAAMGCTGVVDASARGPEVEGRLVDASLVGTPGGVPSTSRSWGVGNGLTSTTLRSWGVGNGLTSNEARAHWGVGNGLTTATELVVHTPDGEVAEGLVETDASPTGLSRFAFTPDRPLVAPGAYHIARDADAEPVVEFRLDADDVAGVNDFGGLTVTLAP